jgi:hypothetical protein
MSPHVAEELDLLPEFLVEMLNHPPQAGSGLHRWLFRCALNLYVHFDEQTIAELLLEKAQHCGRPIDRLEREIWSTIESARAYLWLPSWPSRWALRYERVKAFSALVRRSTK